MQRPRGLPRLSDMPKRAAATILVRITTTTIPVRSKTTTTITTPTTVVGRCRGHAPEDCCAHADGQR